MAYTLHNSKGLRRNEDLAGNGAPHASYAIYDSEARTVTRYRVAYDISATQSRMMEQGLPRRLIARLSYGV